MRNTFKLSAYTQRDQRAHSPSLSNQNDDDDDTQSSSSDPEDPSYTKQIGPLHFPGQEKNMTTSAAKKEKKK